MGDCAGAESGGGGRGVCGEGGGEAERRPSLVGAGVKELIWISDI